MKDKLRELAERLATRIGSQPCTSISSKEVCEFLSILDAEGDGGAGVGNGPASAIVGLLRVLSPHGERWMSDNPNNPAVLNVSLLADKLEAAYTQPTRSGVVSDEDVSVVAKMIANRVGNGMREKYEELAKQIAERFAAITQEKQS